MRIGAPGAEIPVLRHEGAHYDLRPLTHDIDGAFLAADGLRRARDAARGGGLERIDLTGARIGAPVATPGKVVCIGLNYRDHAEETGAAIPQEPVVFMKDPGTVVGPFDEVLIPRGSRKTDWEVELAVVIGTTARYLASDEEAAASIAGYAISNDVSEREFQLERGGQWDKGKSCESFNPLGPWLVPADEVADPQDLGMRLSVNGEQRQNGSTSTMIFGVLEVVRYLSQFMVLRPGDVVNTGTPAGVALGMPTPVYLAPGDRVELSIDGLGTARQLCVAA
ncbi:MAG: FAA hydrolase family protein [Microbacterium sp.]|nr:MULTISPECIES: fumarylacetoacetate hydrolase family protein [Microbacterium]MAL06547.1 FAA hydrolase family protein [Microbacterium sp.]MCK9915490.1 fumarylacetoacetate hydrolase family protein [Microbacteriaceae bacterium K1510]KQR94160.1 2-hydroxyhepta-2,4-diene-1,7-dioate isomerase [Microbacterium sp. Leaf347]MBN9198274.1 fumarylacetoacetate hydrolase family protein [Microbacterium ginsengisoli]MBN9208246.1 fumarylacetoacetate hydrolase family protein [Microbacterium ginsengisoli]